MRKRYLLIGSIAFTFAVARAQNTDTSSNKINQTEIELLYSHYIQDGDNSAVTGGVGTEKLVVYGPRLTLTKSIGKNALNFQVGSDIISSASTDNIDYVVSSASSIDARFYSNIHYTRHFEKSKLLLSGGLGFSIESDYFSVAKYISVSKTSKNEMQNFEMQIQVFNDDLRWGRLNPDHYKPVKLIYPIELRSQEWFNVYQRNSYILMAGFTQIIDKKNILGVFSSFAIQNGLLSTPFHRVYFTDGSIVVESLPANRNKASFSVKWNRFTGGNIILKNAVNSYFDNFGIIGLWLDNETIIKLNYKWNLLSGFRIYTQNNSTYFAPFMKHEANDEYYTSDYDLSEFQSYKITFGFKYKPVTTINIPLDFMLLKYNIYIRTNGLKAHIISLLMNFKYRKGQSFKNRL